MKKIVKKFLKKIMHHPYSKANIRHTRIILVRQEEKIVEIKLKGVEIRVRIIIKTLAVSQALTTQTMG